jgi:hypothetical protein
LEVLTGSGEFRPFGESRRNANNAALAQPQQMSRRAISEREEARDEALLESSRLQLLAIENMEHPRKSGMIGLHYVTHCTGSRREN